jgi:hypothetical protein
VAAPALVAAVAVAVAVAAAQLLAAEPEAAARAAVFSSHIPSAQSPS